MQETQESPQAPERPSTWEQMIPVYGAIRAGQYRADRRSYEFESLLQERKQQEETLQLDAKAKLFEHLTSERDRLSQRSLDYVDRLSDQFTKLADAQQKAAIAGKADKYRFEELAARSQMIIDSLASAAQSDKQQVDAISSALARFMAQEQPLSRMGGQDFSSEGFERPGYSSPNEPKQRGMGPSASQLPGAKLAGTPQQPAMNEDERMAVGAEMGFPADKAGMAARKDAEKRGLDWKKEQYDSYQSKRKEIANRQFEKAGFKKLQLAGFDDASAAAALTSIAEKEDAPGMIRSLAEAAKGFSPEARKQVIKAISESYDEIISGLEDELLEFEPGYKAYGKIGEEAGVKPTTERDKKIRRLMREKYAYAGGDVNQLKPEDAAALLEEVKAKSGGAGS